MEKLAQLFQDVVQLWDKYHVMYLNGIKNTLILALVATVIGCLIGLVCGVLNTIPYTKNDPWPKRNGGVRGRENPAEAAARAHPHLC